MSRLRTLRKERGMSQEDVAFVLGTNQQQISKYENNLASLSERDIIKLARFFGVTADYFLELSDLRLEIATDAIGGSGLDVAEVQELLYHFRQLEGESRKMVIEIEKKLGSRNETGD